MKISTCKSCGAQIVFAVTAKGATMPYDVDAQGNVTTISHFATCPDAKRFSKKKGKKKP